MGDRYFSDKLVKWYENHFRNLPWRETKDPYKIWISEIILQQTRVVQGLPYYNRFIQKYPTVVALAKAKEDDVLRLWQGLGYYSRARNLHKCAKMITTEYQGLFPNTFIELKKLPGIGDYTAAAIASISFLEAVPVVDGNVFRVLSRVYGLTDDIAKPQSRKVFFEKALEIIPVKRPDVFNQAVMELGATVCLPKNPDCDNCPLGSICFAKKHGMQSTLPVKTKAKPPRKRYFYYFILRKGASVFMNRRNEKDIWHGLYDFYLVEKKRSTKVEHVMREDVTLNPLALSSNDIVTSKIYRHVLSHQIILTRFVTLIIDKKEVNHIGNSGFYSKKRVLNLPKPILINRFLDDYKF